MQPSRQPTRQPTTKPSSSRPTSQPTTRPSGSPTLQPTARPSRQPTSAPTRLVKAFVIAKQRILGIVQDSPSLRSVFLSSLRSILPTGSTAKITTVGVYYDDGVIRYPRRSLLQTAVGVEVGYNVTAVVASVTSTQLVGLLALPATVSAMATVLAIEFPSAVLLPPVVYYNVTTAPTSAPADPVVSKGLPSTTTIAVSVVGAVVGFAVLVGGTWLGRKQMNKQKDKDKKLFLSEAGAAGAAGAAGGGPKEDWDEAPSKKLALKPDPVAPDPERPAGKRRTLPTAPSSPRGSLAIDPSSTPSAAQLSTALNRALSPIAGSPAFGDSVVDFFAETPSPPGASANASGSASANTSGKQENSPRSRARSRRKARPMPVSDLDTDVDDTVKVKGQTTAADSRRRRHNDAVHAILSPVPPR
jgi:hypothetical protein